MDTLPVETPTREAFVDVTKRVQGVVDARGFRSGILHVYCPHTTAGLTINEGADPAVAADILAVLRRLVPHRDPVYRHDEGNSDAHVKTALVGSSVAVPVAEGKLALGRWQSILLCEFDGPRRRELTLVFTAGT
jgi:secondary thiamine-phosphate synthase enzyme